MTRLEDTYPNVHKQFTHVVHVVRGSKQFWAIEHVLTRSLTTSGSLTRRRRITETQQPVWYLPRPACTKVNNVMQQLTAVTYLTSEQHKDVSQARQTRGTADSEKLMAFIRRRSPFDADPSLRNIYT